MFSLMRHFVKYCLGLGPMTADPLASLTLIDKPKSKGFHAWTDDEVDAYRKRHAAGTKARLALEVILQTGHARSDVLRMGDQSVESGRLTMARQKTGTEFSIPLLPELVAEPALHRRDGAVASMVWLTTERGTPFGSAASFGNRLISVDPDIIAPTSPASLTSPAPKTGHKRHFRVGPNSGHSERRRTINVAQGAVRHAARQRSHRYWQGPLTHFCCTL